MRRLVDNDVDLVKVKKNKNKGSVDPLDSFRYQILFAPTKRVLRGQTQFLSVGFTIGVSRW